MQRRSFLSSLEPLGFPYCSHRLSGAIRSTSATSADLRFSDRAKCRALGEAECLEFARNHDCCGGGREKSSCQVRALRPAAHLGIGCPSSQAKREPRPGASEGRLEKWNAASPSFGELTQKARRERVEPGLGWCRRAVLSSVQLGSFTTACSRRKLRTLRSSSSIPICSTMWFSS